MSAENQLILVAIIVAVAIAVLGKASTPSVQEITSTDPLNTAPVGVIRDKSSDQSSNGPGFERGVTGLPPQEIATTSPIFFNG